MTLSAPTIGDYAAGVLPFVWFGWFDIVGDPLRATTLAGGRTFGASETVDADLNGQTFDFVPASIINIGPVVHGAGGQPSVTATLSGIPGSDTTLLTALADASDWQGRKVRLWRGLNLGGGLKIQSYFLGRMVAAPLTGDPASGQAISMRVETYQALYASPRGRSWQDQGHFDAGDLSPARIRAAANGSADAGVTGSGGSGSSQALRDVVAQLA